MEREYEQRNLNADEKWQNKKIKKIWKECFRKNYEKTNKMTCIYL